MAVDYRKLLIAQMLECSQFDGGWPSVDGLGNEESEAYEVASLEAQRVESAARACGDWHYVQAGKLAARSD